MFAQVQEALLDDQALCDELNDNEPYPSGLGEWDGKQGNLPDENYLFCPEYWEGYQSGCQSRYLDQYAEPEEF